VQYVVAMKKNIVKSVNIAELAAGLNARWGLGLRDQGYWSVRRV